MGLKLRKLQENWAAENYSGPSANIAKLRNSYWKVCNGPCVYLKHGITKDAFIVLQTSVRGAQVLWLVYTSVYPAGPTPASVLAPSAFAPRRLGSVWDGPASKAAGHAPGQHVTGSCEARRHARKAIAQSSVRGPYEISQSGPFCTVFPIFAL